MRRLQLSKPWSATVVNFAGKGAQRAWVLLVGHLDQPDATYEESRFVLEDKRVYLS